MRPGGWMVGLVQRKCESRKAFKFRRGTLCSRGSDEQSPIPLAPCSSHALFPSLPRSKVPFHSPVAVRKNTRMPLSNMIMRLRQARQFEDAIQTILNDVMALLGAE